MTKLIFLDTETSGLDPRRHEIWELYWKEYGLEHGILYPGSVYHFQMEILITNADLIALNIGGYFDERRQKFGGATCEVIDNSTRASSKHAIAQLIQRRWHDAMLVGANPAFDQSFLAPFLYSQGCIPTWGYHLCDIRALVNGFLAGRAKYQNLLMLPEDFTDKDFLPPWRGKRQRTCELLGLDPEDGAFKEHTAEGDTNLVIAQFVKVMGLQVKE